MTHTGDTGQDGADDPIVARWMRCEKCGWKTREYAPDEELALGVSCPYCIYGGQVVACSRTASEAVAKADVFSTRPPESG